MLLLNDIVKISGNNFDIKYFIDFIVNLYFI
jgi:hypothetical protein